jgi:hypothetical protein
LCGADREMEEMGESRLEEGGYKSMA